MWRVDEMREIKFRAWSKSNGCFCSAFSIHMSGRISDMIDAKIDKDSGLAISDAHWGENDLEIMQFTGILDKNDVKIYEGDVVKDGCGIYEIRWSESRLSWIVADDSSDYYDRLSKLGKIEVIGNIYENPELLEMK